MNLFEAKKLLEKNGCKLIKEDADTGLTDYTPADVLSKLYDRIYRHWLDADLDYSDIASAFHTGWEGTTDWQEFRSRYDEDYGGHVMHLEAIFFPFDERKVAEIIDSCIRCAAKERLFYDRLEYLKEIFDMFPSAFMDIDKDGRLVLDYHGRQYDLEIAYDVRDSFMLLLLAKDMKKNDEYDEWVKACESSLLKKD